ncbi:hypothetical protein [Kurthia massiliensis]|uniref:hypothetical protein n=1 Tax=Kurthia massiliensis TaxID=1033739 RepID=UPI000287B8CA|nr:hypothetical protein [Kurthia massiliensis]
MKKLLLASVLMFSTSTVATATLETPIEASAKVTQKKMTASLAKAMKQGKFPNAKGKIGMTYSKLTKVAPAYFVTSDNDVLLYAHSRSKKYAGNPLYLDAYFFNNKNFNNKSKVQSVQRLFDYTFTSSSLKKYFGNPLKVTATDRYYKVGDYVAIFTVENNQTYLFVSKVKYLLL